MKYIAMINIPGCLPECEPREFDTYKEALESLVEEFELNDDSHEYEDEIAIKKMQEYNTALSQLMKRGYCHYQNYYYGVENSI